MKVLQVSAGPLTGPATGGAERCCLELSRWLSSSGVDVLVAAAAAPGKQPFERITELQPARWKPTRKVIFDYVSPGNAHRLHEIIDEFRPEIVHFHNIYGIGSRLVRVASERAQAVVTVHDYWPLDVFVPRVVRGHLRYPPRDRLLRPWVIAHRALHRHNLRSATLVSPSRYLARRLEDAGYQSVRVIPNGLAAHGETASAERRILFVGRLAPEKGLREALLVIEPVARDLGWQIDVAGDGPQRAMLERRYPQVRFRGRVDASPFYRRAGIVVIPSRWPENFPYVALEAMSNGVPVLAANAGGLPEIVDDGVTGRLYEADQPDQLRAALRELASDAALRERLGRAARERVAQDYSWNVVGQRYLALYEELSPARSLPRVGVHAG